MSSWAPPPPNSVPKGNRYLTVGFIALVVTVVIALGISMPKVAHLLHERRFTIESASMAPTIIKGDRIVVDISAYKRTLIADGDVVAFRHGDLILVKRVEGVAGELVQGRAGKIVRNGKLVNEPYLLLDEDHPLPEIDDFSAQTVPVGQIFVAGDSREKSFDSRAANFGPVKTSDVLGRVVNVHPANGNAPDKHL